MRAMEAAQPNSTAESLYIDKNGAVKSAAVKSAAIREELASLIAGPLEQQSPDTANENLENISDTAPECQMNVGEEVRIHISEAKMHRIKNLIRLGGRWDRKYRVRGKFR